MKKIPFNKPTLVGTESNYMMQCVANAHLSGDGDFTKLCQEILEKTLGALKALLTTSGTHALEMTALLLDFKQDDEVILPSFTFPSTVNAFVLRGMRPVFADIRPDTLNIDETQIEKLVTSRTKAVVIVHYAGVACEMDAILGIAKKYNLIIIEDNAHGLFGKYKDKYLGTFGTLAMQSFHETKNFSCGEGGALIINDEKFIDRAEIIREKGTDRSRFFRGEVDKYSWIDIGSSYVPSDLLAAYLYAKLEVADQIQTEREQIWHRYAAGLCDWTAENSVRLPFVPTDCEQAFHLFYMILPSLQERDSLIAHLKNNGIHGIFHYQPLHLSKMGQSFGGRRGDCPVTENVSECLLRLPFFNGLSVEDQRYVIEKISEYNVTANRPYASTVSLR